VIVPVNCPYVLKLSSGPSPEPPPEPSISSLMTGSLKTMLLPESLLPESVLPETVLPESVLPDSAASRRLRCTAAMAGAFTSGARRFVLACWCRARKISSSSVVSNSCSKLKAGKATVICNIVITQSPSNTARMLGLHGP